MAVHFSGIGGFARGLELNFIGSLIFAIIELGRQHNRFHRRGCYHWCVLSLAKRRHSRREIQGQHKILIAYHEMETQLSTITPQYCILVSSSFKLDKN